MTSSTVVVVDAFNSSIPAATVVVPRRLNEGPAFARVDSLTGGQFFRTMFAINPVPYAAFPSGHVAWPMCVYLTQPWANRWPFVAYVTLVSWATMYSGHHYLSDVVASVAITLAINRLLSIKPSPMCSTDEPVQPSVLRRLRSIFRFPFSLFRIFKTSTDRQTTSPYRNKGLSLA